MFENVVIWSEIINKKVEFQALLRTDVYSENITYDFWFRKTPYILDGRQFLFKNLLERYFCFGKIINLNK